MMAFRRNIIIFLLCTVAIVSSIKNSGKSSKNKANLSKLSENINKNPFLQSTTDPPILSENINNNLFLENHYTIVFPNGENPFLSHIKKPLVKPSLSPISNSNNQSQIAYETNKESMAIVDGNVVFNKGNPFLQSDLNTNNNPVQAIPLNNSSGLNEKVPVSNKISNETTTFAVTKTKSELKCEEYGKYISRTTEILSLVGTDSNVIKVTSQKCLNENRLVVGGTIAIPGEFPHMVALGTKTVEGAFNHLCGGTLIAPEWILTAAHCTYEPNPTDVRIGFHDLRDNQHGIRTTVSKIIRHPGYKPPAVYADIALIKLNITITFNKEIRPACLYQPYDTVPTKAWVSGWGLTEFGGEDVSNQLQKAELDIIDNLSCAIRHSNSTKIPYGITPSMICAGDPRGGWNKDTCQGDSGGPLQIITSKNSCLFQVLGITSFGHGCAVIDIPGVYTRVSHYLTWIEDTIWP